jgi:hypothetical protein
VLEAGGHFFEGVLLRSERGTARHECHY